MGTPLKTTKPIKVESPVKQAFKNLKALEDTHPTKTSRGGIKTRKKIAKKIPKLTEIKKKTEIKEIKKEEKKRGTLGRKPVIGPAGALTEKKGFYLSQDTFNRFNTAVLKEQLKKGKQQANYSLIVENLLIEWMDESGY